MKRRFKRAEPYVAPPGSPPMSEVVQSLFAKGDRLKQLDADILMKVAALERKLREQGVERVYSVKLPDGADLGWSRDRRRRYWRLVIRDGEDVMELRECEPEERSEVFTCGAMGKLIARIQEDSCRGSTSS